MAPLNLQDWIVPDEQMAADLAVKERLLDERHPDVFAALPAAQASSAEVLDLLLAHLPARFPHVYRRAGARFDNLATGQCWNLAQSTLHPLDLSGRLVQEDLCLMQSGDDGVTYHLVGASVCFPTRWCLREKIGKSVGAIHAPVPDYAPQLGVSMDRFFKHLKAERPVWRRNWSLMDDPTLFQPAGHGRQAHDTNVTADNAGNTVWLRIERQTLRRLPRSGAILFTIRLYVDPLHRLAACPPCAAALAAAIRSLPPAMQRYKSIAPIRDAVLAWLDRVEG